MRGDHSNAIYFMGRSGECYGVATKIPLLEFFRGAAHLKNMQTSSSGEGMACVGGLENFFLRMLEIISKG